MASGDVSSEVETKPSEDIDSGDVDHDEETKVAFLSAANEATPSDEVDQVQSKQETDEVDAAATDPDAPLPVELEEYDRLDDAQQAEVETALQTFYQDSYLPHTDDITNLTSDEKKQQEILDRKREVLAITVQLAGYTDETQAGKDLYLYTIIVFHDAAIEGRETNSSNYNVYSSVQKNIAYNTQVFFISV